MKKYIIPILALIILILSIWGYVVMRKGSVSSKTDPYISVPGEPCAVFQINSLKEFEESLLYNNNYWLNLTSIKSLNRTHRLIATLDSLQEADDNVKRLITDRNILIAAYPSATSDTEILFSTQISESGYKLAHQTLDSCAITPESMAYYKEFLLISNSDSLISKAKATIDAKTSPIMEDIVFSKVRKFASGKQKATVFINAERCKVLLEKRLGGRKAHVYDVSDQYGSWGAYDVDLSEDKIEINGFAYSNIAGGTVQAFENQATDRNTLSAYMPYNTFFFRHFAISNFEDYRRIISPDDDFPDNGLQNIDDETIETSSGESPLTFFQDYFGGEIAYGESPFDEFVIVKLYNSDEALTTLRRMALDINPESSVKRGGLEIFHIGRNGFAGSVFGKYFTLPDEYLCIANDNLIITPSAHFTNHIATRNPKTQTLICSPVFRSADRTLLSTSNRSVYIDIPYVVRNADKFFKPEVAGKIKKAKQMWSSFDCIGLQSENRGGGLDYQHVFIQYSGKPGSYNPIEEPKAVVVTPAEPVAQSPAAETQAQAADAVEPARTFTVASKAPKQLFTVKLDAPAAIKPQKFTNHYTGENEIFIQDTNNQIYLISASGKILWKTTLSEPIIGGICEVDMLQNKKLQIAFLTKTRLYIIDRNGKILSGFPKQLQGEACTTLSVFDYDGNKNYRFAYGTSDNRVYITQKDGSVLKEWENVYTKSPIDGQIKHIRISGKDYIAFADADKTYLLDRKAKVRLSCGAELVKSKGNDIYSDLSGMKIVMTLSNGKICFITSADKATSTMLRDYGANHRFVKSDKCYMFGFKGGVDVYDSNMNLVFSDNKSDISDIDACGWHLGAYSGASKRLYIFSRDSDGTFSKEEIKAASEQFSIIPLKPYTLPVAVVCNGSTLTVYDL